MSVLADAQEEILRRDIVLTVEADVLFPRIGGYNARPYSSKLQLYELPRAPELKALWRWWLRVILSGAYGGQKSYEELESDVGKILGGRERQSRFAVIVDCGKAEEMIRSAKDKIDLARKLLLEVIPNVVEKFAQEYVSKDLIKLKKIKEIKLLPISIRFTNQGKDEREFNEVFKKIFGLEPRKDKKDKLEIEKADDLFNLMKHLDVRHDERIANLYGEIVKLTNIPRVKLLLQPRKEYGEDNKIKIRSHKVSISKENRRYLERVFEDIAGIIAPCSDLSLEECSLPIRVSIAINDRGGLGGGDPELRLAFASFLLSLLLGGIGSITRRGFGSIILKDVSFNSRYKDLLKDVGEKVNGILQAEDKGELENKLKEYINMCLEYANHIVRGGEAQTESIPMVPTLNENYFKLKVFECDGDDIDILSSIGYATLKAQWKKVCESEERKQEEEFHTWILGLPRSAVYIRYTKGHKEERRTGYFVDNERGRRPSAIALKIFKNKKGKSFVIVYGFLSGDWPIGKLRHVSDSRKNESKEVTSLNIATPECNSVSHKNSPQEEFLKEVFERAFEFVSKIIEKSKCREVKGYEAGTTR